MHIRIPRGFTLFLLLLMGMIGTGSFLSMLTMGEMYVLNEGDSIQLSCEFETYNFNLFDNPVLWKKMQKNEESQINLLSNIYKPFVKSDRFSVSFMPSVPRYKLELTIMDLKREDSGNYSCEVRSPQSKVIQDVTHTIYVRTPVDELYLSSDNKSIYTGNKVLKYNEIEPGTIRCLSIGGYPPPELRVYLDDEDITNQLTPTSLNKLTGERGMRMMTHTRGRFTRNFYAKPEHDGKLMRCLSTVLGLGTNETSALIRVDYSPIVTCHDKRAKLNQLNVDLWCEVQSKPGTDKLIWVTDNNGTTVENGIVANEFWTIVTIVDKDEGIIHTQLFMRKAWKEKFRTYTLIAGNAVGMTRTQVKLDEILPVTTRKPIYNYGRVTTRDPIRENRGYLTHSAGSHIHIPAYVSTLVFLSISWMLS